MNTDYMPAELHGNLVWKGTGGNLSAHLLAFPIKIYMYIYNYTYWDGIILTDFILYTFLRWDIFMFQNFYNGIKLNSFNFDLSIFFMHIVFVKSSNRIKCHTISRTYIKQLMFYKQYLFLILTFVYDDLLWKIETLLY